MVSVYADANKTMMSASADSVKCILSSVSVYGTIVRMPRGTQNTEDIDRAIASILKERAEFLGKSERALALETSVSRWRVNDIFTMKRPILVNELEELADALGLVGSSVMREAERSLEDRADNVAPFPSGHIYGAGYGEPLTNASGKPYAALDRGYDPDDEATHRND